VTGSLPRVFRSQTGLTRSSRPLRWVKCRLPAVPAAPHSKEKRNDVERAAPVRLGPHRPRLTEGSVRLAA
jgi:hypothetical protein